jgi:hypothetical protein
MTSPLPFRLIVAAFISFFILVSTSHAGGSISREEFLDTLSDPSIRQYVAEHFQLAEEGRSLRAGRHMPNAGARIPPYEILARPHFEGEEPVVLEVKSERSTQVRILPCAESVFYDSHCG